MSIRTFYEKIIEKYLASGCGTCSYWKKFACTLPQGEYCFTKQKVKRAMEELTKAGK